MSPFLASLLERVYYRGVQPKDDQHRAFAPHCDPSVLHSKESGCIHCQKYPDWQELRRRQRINFTGEHDPKKAPCPSENFRDVSTIYRWPGNRPRTGLDDGTMF